MRGRVQRAVVTTVQQLGDRPNEAAVSALLARLEQRARENGVVTALDVEPGLAAIDTLTPVIGPAATRQRQTAFASKMSELADALRTRTPPDASAAPARSTDEVARALEGTHDPAERASLVREYLRAVDALPEAQRESAMDRLNQLAGSETPGTPEQLLDQLRDTDAPGDRATLTNELLRLIASAPEAEQRRYLDELRQVRR